MKKKFLLKLRGKTAVFVDWANAYNWKDSLKWEIDPKKLLTYLESYPKVKEISFYFGTDEHPASKQQIKETQKIGFRTITKPVKYLPVKDKGVVIWKRKCDFDLEIGLDCFEKLDRFDSFIFFSGDGDFATLYERLVKRKKQVIVIYAHGHLGREIYRIKRGVYKCAINRIKNEVKKMPPHRRRGA